MGQVKNVAASVFQRLKNKSREVNRPLEYLLVHYAIERFLYRLSQSEYRGTFILKGGLAFLTLDDTFPRTTRDIDLLGFTENAVENVKAIVAAICRLHVADDGLAFGHDAPEGESIKIEDKYSGVRVKLMAHLGNARIPMQIDCGFGDAVYPTAEWVAYPTLLDSPAPHLRVYPPETILAEKVHAIVQLDLLNSRLKDFYDIWFLSETRTIDGATLCEAFARTFECRKTALPHTIPDTFLDAFQESNEKQWTAFTRKFHADLPFPEFSEVLLRVRVFVRPPLEALSSGQPLLKMWLPAQGWSKQT